ncbi:putative thimet oligopeptidase, putative,metallo-peptidase, clan MA(E), family M3 [Trypanosoma grayi]|uniref:putative thimet oligopeptidase, putative,metallo-peptidase, clan MA(E), family M3 n=1 Tax=Trypanosoma grayi TaxID=71804 RepID=UPI0004F49A1A|nr:putative thimet oligopeptidase, putative,metallo-peptidase, clan MA(E), family M3 [Trypanosoma grayi]KEG10282.1 putative thimet oligopeptidase, putative,metallo-peptidase, clan MA(E), family M3 [Trypanosoma grayi]
MALRIFADVGNVKNCASMFPKTVSACQLVAQEAKTRAMKKLNEIYSCPDASRTFANTAELADIAAAEFDISTSLLSVAMSVLPDESTREEANKQIVELKSFEIDNFQSNKRLFEALKTVSLSPGYKEEYINGSKNKEYSYWLEEELRDYRRKGMELPEDKFNEVVALQKELSALCTTFSRNISEDKSQVLVSAEELKGVPENVINGLKKTDDGMYILKMDYPTFFGVMKNCEVAATRKAMARAAANKAYPMNGAVLKEMIAKRQKLAELLGFPSYSYLNLDDKMAKSPDIARSFVDDLIPRLQKKWKSELEMIKKHLHESCVLTEEGLLQEYDVSFMMNQIKKNQLNVSETEIQEYFPLDVTVKGLFDIYQAFFDLTFTRIDNGSELWDKDAFTLHVAERATGRTLGHVILDLFPRDGKYSHACCHSVVPPVLLEGAEDEFSPALAVVIANFPAPSGDQPALFLHDDVTTFFHEFGHAIHGLMGRSRMATFAGTNVKWDFVELPSQMLEEWVWEPEILRKISSHYKTKNKLPSKLAEAKVKSRNAFSGRDALRQLEFATYSLEIFGAPFANAKDPSNLDTTKLMIDIRTRITPEIKCESGTHFECGFGHLTGYGAGYYGYMWSKVFALDVYDYIKSRSGLLDPNLGRRYVTEIIGVGGGRDPSDMLKKFLGREPNNNAFLKNLGV